MWRWSDDFLQYDSKDPRWDRVDRQSDKFDSLVSQVRDDTSVPDRSVGQCNICLQIERVFSFAGLEGTLESIIRVKWVRGLPVFLLVEVIFMLT